MIPAVNGASIIPRLLSASPRLRRGVVLCLLALGALSSAAIETPPVSLDEIRWKRFQPASEVYIDTRLQFTPAADVTPNVDVTKDKLALWLNVEAAERSKFQVQSSKFKVQSSKFQVQSRDGLESETRNFEPGTLNPEPGTRNLEPGTLNPEPGTLNPRPVALTNLCVYASWADLAAAPATRKGGLVIGARRAMTSVKPRVYRLMGTSTIEPGRWYRLTVRTIKDVTRRAAKTGDASKGLLGFQIYLDGALLRAEEPSFSEIYTTYAAGSEGWLDSVKDADLLAFLRSGTVFVSLCGESADDAVASVGFRGEGELEDVDITAEAPAFLGVSSLDFTLALTPEESVVADLVGE